MYWISVKNWRGGWTFIVKSVTTSVYWKLQQDNRNMKGNEKWAINKSCIAEFRISVQRLHRVELCGIFILKYKAHWDNWSCKLVILKRTKKTKTPQVESSSTESASRVYDSELRNLKNYGLKSSRRRFCLEQIRRDVLWCELASLGHKTGSWVKVKGRMNN